MWSIATTDEFNAWFTELDDEAREEVAAKVDLLRSRGPQLGRPHADTLSGSKHANMKELRADTANKVMRIAFAFDPTRSAILLVAGDKLGVNQKRFYKQLIARAEQLYDLHLARIKTKRKDETHGQAP